VVGCGLPPKLYDQLQRLADQQQITLSAAMREMITKGLQTVEK
jgi:hypothetical protein